MEFITQALKALPSVASSPLALVAYIVAVGAWLLIALRVQRHKGLLTNLEKLPSRDRLAALKDEMGVTPLKEGLTAEQYLKSRIHLYYILAFGILCLTVVILFVVASVRSEVLSSRTVKIFGKVYQAGDRRIGVKNARVYLEREITRSVQTDDSGEFVFEVPQSDLNTQASIWAEAEKFAPSKRETIIIQPLDKIFIALESIREAAINPTITRGDVSLSDTPASFYIMYRFDPPGRRDWAHVQLDLWTERFPDGKSSQYRLTGRSEVDGCTGLVLYSVKNNGFEVFIPDKGCDPMYLQFRWDNAPWTPFGMMFDVR
jgi:hypothetical protein